MSILRRILGPSSKYDDRLPFTYEARTCFTGLPGSSESYICDTLCGLLERLASEGIEPEDAALFEIRPEGEYPVPVEHCVDVDGNWLRRPSACESFATYYAGHERAGHCCYRDRTRDAEGPLENQPEPVVTTGGSGRA